jgi:hypothetical protein
MRRRCSCGDVLERQGVEFGVKYVKLVTCSPRKQDGTPEIGASSLPPQPTCRFFDAARERGHGN